MGYLANGANVKIDPEDCTGLKNCGVEFYVDGILTPAENIPAGKWFVVKRTNPELGMFVIVSTNTNESKVRLAKHGTDICPDWAQGIFGANCTTTDDLPIRGK